MIFEENNYTSMLSGAISIAAKVADTSNKVAFLVGGNIIFGDIIPDDDERFYLDKDNFTDGSSLIMLAVSTFLKNRYEGIETKLTEEEIKNLESVYIYLENVSIHSTSNNKTIHTNELCLKISSIDGVFAGDPTSLIK